MNIVYSQSVDGLENSITVSFTAKDFTEKVNTKLKQLVGKAKLDGFRKGKIPLSVLRMQYQKSINQDVALEASVEAFYEAAKQKNISLASNPAFEKLDVNDAGEIIFSASFETMPIIEMPNLGEFEFQVISAKVSAADVDKMLQNLRNQEKIWSEATNVGNAKLGTRVTIDFVGTINGEEFSGGSSQDFKLELGSNSMIPGFEEGIIGMKKNEQKKISLQFPDNYQVKDLQSKNADFLITLKLIENSKLPEIDEDFIKKYGTNSGKLTDFKSDLKSRMSFELENRLKAMTKEQIFQQVSEKANFDIPKSWIKQENEMMAEAEQKNYQAQGLKDVSFIKPEMYEKVSINKIRVSLVLQKIIQDQKFNVSDEEVKVFIESQKSKNLDSTARIDAYYKKTENLEKLKSILVEQKAIDFIKEAAKVSSIEKTFFEIFPTN